MFMEQNHTCKFDDRGNCEVCEFGKRACERQFDFHRMMPTEVPAINAPLQVILDNMKETLEPAVDGTIRGMRVLAVLKSLRRDTDYV